MACGLPLPANANTYNNNIYSPITVSSGGGNFGLSSNMGNITWNYESEMFRHAYEKGILDYINGCVDEKIIPVERMRKLKLDKI